MKRPRIRLTCAVTGDVLLIDVDSLIAVRECRYRKEACVILRAGVDFLVCESLAEVQSALDAANAELERA